MTSAKPRKTAKTPSENNTSVKYDIIIVGAGPAGLSTAKAVSQLGLKVAIIERQGVNAILEPKYDGREIALTHRSQHMMSELDMWDRIAPEEISIIQSAKVYNAGEEFFMGLSSNDTKQLAYIISNHEIRKSAIDVVKDDANVKIYDNEGIEDLKINPKNVVVKLKSGTELDAKLLIAADSRFSDIRDMVGLPASKYNFEKTMIVAKMRHEKSHEYIASENFHIGHTMAILPLNDNCCSMVVTVKHDEAKRLMALSDEEYTEWCSENFGHKLGKMELITARYPYPLVGVYSDKFVSKRFALIGDAAVGMHPVTAHGFNFGLTGIEFLRNSLRSALARGQDIGSWAVLKEFETNHQRATLPLYLGTAAIVKLYTNDHPVAQVARKVLIRVADKMSPIKGMIMDKLMDDHAGNPMPLPRPLQLLKLLRNA
ncbi:5-demethoxyubiquinol-8 5-hydroxylase UbiM [Pseudaquidulcibacter saccharophilus]|uniref:5-demethoxyubiquinol-8 5-hydroxylase UbiM n=1 Tax=Pseudaquidulcibacter saccharophilus TaxID=2831900 RepID=UPI001EFF42F5